LTVVVVIIIIVYHISSIIRHPASSIVVRHPPSVIRHPDREMPEVYYDAGRKEFLMQDERGV
jgi:hypothetical protein